MFCMGLVQASNLYRLYNAEGTMYTLLPHRGSVYITV